MTNEYNNILGNVLPCWEITPSVFKAPAFTSKNLINTKWKIPTELDHVEP